MTTWTTPRTWTNSDPTASQFNTDLRDNSNYLKERLPGYIDAVSTNVTFSNSTAENDLWSYSVAGGEMTATGLMRFDFWVVCSNSKGSSGNLTLKFYIGANSVTVASNTINDAASGTYYRSVLVRGDGTTSSQRIIYFGHTLINGSANGGIPAVEATTATDISTAQTWKLTATLNAASANFSVTCRFAGLTYNVMGI